MRKRFLFLTLVLLSAMTLHADDYASWYTADQVNGRFWTNQSLNQADKALFVMAFSAGLRHAILFHDAKNETHTWPFGMNNSEIAKALDRFYDTPENVLIPVGWAIMICRQRLDGISETAIQETIRIFRQFASTGSPTPTDKQK